jgi:hypothetical protein
MGTPGSFDPTTLPSDDTAYAMEALAAWQAGDDATVALLCAQPDPFSSMAARGADRAATWIPSGSEGAAGTIYIRFNDQAGHTLAFGFVNGPLAPQTGPDSQHRIMSISYIP